MKWLQKKLWAMALLLLLFSPLAHAAQGVIVFRGTNPAGLLVEGQVSGVQKSPEPWTGVIFSGTIQVSGPVPGGVIQGNGPVTLVTNPVGKGKYEGRAQQVPLHGILAFYGHQCTLLDTGLLFKLTIAPNNEATVEMGSTRPSNIQCPGTGTHPGPPLLPAGYQETVPILLH